MSTLGKLFLCNKCGAFKYEADFLKDPSFHCFFCSENHGGHFIDTGKTYQEWESILSLQPDAPPETRLGGLPFDDVLSFARKQVIAPMGTFDQAITDEVKERIRKHNQPHCPRCFSTNIEVRNGYDDSSDYVWDSNDGSASTGCRKRCLNCGYKWQR